MTWRERIVAARERGHFTAEDIARAWKVPTCALGEALALLEDHGVVYTSSALRDAAGDTMSRVNVEFPMAVSSAEFSKAEYLLDEILDAADRAKRKVQP